MKKAIFSLLLAGSLILTGCGDSGNDFTQVSGQQGSPGPITTPTPTPTPTSGYFVDAATGNDATANPANGTPYKTIGAAVNTAPTGTDIVVRPGTYAESITLKNSQRLLGSGSTRITAQSVQRPVLNGSIILGDGNTVDYIEITGTDGMPAIDGDDQNGGTVTDCQIADTVNLSSGIQAHLASGTWTIENNAMSNLSGLGVDLRAGLGDVTTAYVNNNDISGNDFNALGFLAQDNGQLRVQANDNIMTGNQATATFEVITLDTGTVTLQIIGNENDDVYRFSATDVADSIKVENFADLETLNTGTVLVDILSVEDIADAGF